MQYLNSHKYSNHFLHFICKFFGFHLQSYIEYVIGSLEKNTTEIKNMRAYLLTALYNSIDTLDTAALYGA